MSITTNEFHNNLTKQYIDLFDTNELSDESLEKFKTIVSDIPNIYDDNLGWAINYLIPTFEKYLRLSNHAKEDITGYLEQNLEKYNRLVAPINIPFYKAYLMHRIDNDISIDIRSSILENCDKLADEICCPDERIVYMREYINCLMHHSDNINLQKIKQLSIGLNELVIQRDNLVADGIRLI